ncbi:MFS transporter, partial [Chloroflexota bacterium]
RFFYGWFVVGACMSAGIAIASVANPVLSLFMKPMGFEFGWSRTAFSAVIIVAAIAGSLLSITVGPIIDKRGSRIVLVLGSAIIGGCLAALSKVQAIWHFYAVFGVARAIMGGAINLAIPVVVANWFILKRGRVMGVTAAAPRIGSALLALIAQWLINRAGWRFSWIGLGFLTSVIAVIPPALFVRRRPEDMGLKPDGEMYTERKQAITLSANPAAAEDILSGDQAWRRNAVLATPAFWLLALAEAQGGLVIGAVHMHQFPYLTDVGITRVAAVAAVSLGSLFAIAGSLLWGRLAERIPAKHCLILVFAVQAVSILVLIYARTIAMAYVFATLWGLSVGGAMPLFSIIWAEYYGRISLASVRGLGRPLHLIANAFGPIIAGRVYDTTGSYERAFIVFIAIFLSSSLLVFLSKTPPKKESKYDVSKLG